MAAIDTVRQAFKSGRRRYVVKAWGDMEVWSTAVTPNDMDGLDSRNPKTAMERSLLLLIAKLTDADGKPLFDAGHLHFLKAETDVSVVADLVNFIYGDLGALPDDSEKAVAAAKEVLQSDPPSGSVSA